MPAPTPLAAFARRKARLPPAAAVRPDLPHWRPGSKSSPGHCELFAPGDEAGGVGLALAFALDQTGDDARPFLWVQDRAALRLCGRPYRPGLPPALRDRLIHVAADKPEDALFALEEGLRCRDLAFVVGELAGNPRALSFTASRRLTLTAERYGVPLWLVRIAAERDLSSARMRWAARSAISHPPEWNREAPGSAAWQAELFRARAHPPGEWILDTDSGTLGQRAMTVPAQAGLAAWATAGPHPA